MSRSARLFLFTALVYLALGLVLDAVAMMDVWLGFNPLAYTTVGATMQAFLVGWLTQSVMALLYDRLVKPVRLVAVVWACLNVGLALTILGQPVLAFTGNDLVGGLVAMGGLMQAAGGIMFAAEVIWAMRTRRKGDTR